MKEIRILNVGAGVGSTTVFELARMGEIPAIDHGIFADTQEEPADVYAHLQWMLSVTSFPIHVVTAGKLGNDLLAGRNAAGKQSKKGRFASVPAFTTQDHEQRDGRPATGCEVGRTNRQCTSEYKILPIERHIRSVILGLKKGSRIPRDVRVVQIFGLDDGEAGRIAKVKKRYMTSPFDCDFPLAKLGMDRNDCLRLLATRVPHQVPRSACVFCPYRSNLEWQKLRNEDPAGWARAVEIDDGIRDPQARGTAGLRQSLYLHRSAVPLKMVDIDALAAKERAKPKQPNLFAIHDQCGEGMCGV